MSWLKTSPFGKVLLDSEEINLAFVSFGIRWWYWNYAAKQSTRDQPLYRQTKDPERAERLRLGRTRVTCGRWECYTRPLASSKEVSPRMTTWASAVFLLRAFGGLDTGLARQDLPVVVKL